MAGLLDFAKTPEFMQWATGVAGGLSRAGRGRGFDISGANQQLYQGMADRQQAEKMKGLMGGFGLNPQQTALFEGMLPEVQQRAMLGFMDPQGKDPAVWQQKMNEMVRGGMDPEIARGIAAGGLELRTDPISGKHTVMDLRSGQPYSYGGATAQAAPAAPTTVPRDVGYGAALGGQGLVSSVANTVADAIGLDLPAPEAERAAQALQNLQTRTATILQSSIPGRPSNYLMQQFEGLTVTPGSLFQGEQRSTERLGQTRNLVKRAIEDADAVINNSGDFQPKQIAEARRAKIAFEGLLRDYEIILGKLGGGEEQPQMLQAGQVDNGYRFKGGDPFDENNWEPVP